MSGRDDEYDGTSSEENPSESIDRGPSPIYSWVASDEEVGEEVDEEAYVDLWDNSEFENYVQRVEPEEGDLNSGEEETEAYNPEITTEHSYFGVARCVRGRGILDEDVQHKLFVHSYRDNVLMPYQTIPITFFDPYRIKVVKSIIETTKVIGVIHSARGYLSEKFGTTAEILTYTETETRLIIKARGSQRFKVIQIEYNNFGPKAALVEILKEERFSKPFFGVHLRSRNRLVPLMPLDNENDNGHRDRESQELCQAMSRILPHDDCKTKDQESDTRFKSSPYNIWRFHKVCPLIGPFSNWVYEMYDERILVDRIQQGLKRNRLSSSTYVNIPSDPMILSYWTAYVLPLESLTKLKILKMSSFFERLRFEVHLIEKLNAIGCRSCRTLIAKTEDIIFMSKEGPQGTYVNSNGCVQDTLTVSEVSNVRASGNPTTEYSWFPGYAWSFIQCINCDLQAGWKFTSVDKKLTPPTFYGLTNRSTVPIFEMEDKEA